LDSASSLEVGEVAASLDLGTDEHDRFFAGLLVGFSSQFSDEDDSMRTIREAIATARDEHDDVDLMLAAGRAALYVGDDEAAERFNGRIVARARSISSIGCLAIGGTRLAFAEILLGKWNSAVATAEETSRLAEDTGQEELAAHALVWRGLIAAFRGDENLCRDLIHEATAITTARHMKLVDDAAIWAEGALDLTLGRYGDALRKLQRVSHPVIAIAAALDRVEAAHQLGANDDARASVDELEHFARSSEAAWAAARLSHCRGLLADDPAEATTFFEQALLDHDRATRPFERARTELAFGSHLRRVRQRVVARDHLRAALEAFESLGSTPWAERARTELRASGETARRRDPSTINQLTAQELQVVRLVARGMTNREVATQLFVSPRTIDFHLRNVYSKLGIASRNQLAALDLAL
jgi:ATP/maltotriose-dependent transcriptional regulator MalT